MEGKYVVHYSLFGFNYNGFKSYFKFFDDKEELEQFIKLHPNIHKGNYLIFERNKEIESEIGDDN